MRMHPVDPFLNVTPIPVPERGDWLATSLGGMWSILNPHPMDVEIADIAAGLSRNCRYGGQLKDDVDFLSICEHSCIMTEFAVDTGIARSREDALAVLLHDAAEAYFGDMPTPLKRLIPRYREMENMAQSMIAISFGITEKHLTITKNDIKLIDERIRIDERRAVIAEPAASIGIDLIWDRIPDLRPLNRKIDALNPREARLRFIETFNWVMGLTPANPESDIVLERHKAGAIKCLNIMNGVHSDNQFTSSPT